MCWGSWGWKERSCDACPPRTQTTKFSQFHNFRRQISKRSVGWGCTSPVGVIYFRRAATWRGKRLWPAVASPVLSHRWSIVGQSGQKALKVGQGFLWILLLTPAIHILQEVLPGSTEELLIHMHIIIFIITSALLTEGCCPAIFKHKDGTKAGGQGQDPPWDSDSHLTSCRGCVRVCGGGTRRRGTI